MKKRKAVISVSDKTGVAEFSKELHNLGWEIISSRGTAEAISQAGIPVTDVAKITGIPPILKHKLVTIDPKISGGLLSDTTPEDLADLAEYGIPWLDMVVVDLYHLEEEIKKPGSNLNSVLEHIDIGGVLLLRAAAKGMRITIPQRADYQLILGWLKEGEPERDKFLRSQAAKTFFITAKYDLAAARYLGEGMYDGMIGRKVADCAYGENKYQKPAAVYTTDTGDPLSIPDAFKLVQGMSPSFNNYVDMDRLLQTLTHITTTFMTNRGRDSAPYAAIVVKHGNACGAAVGWSIVEVLKKMIIGDMDAIFGGLVITNFGVKEEEAEILLHWNLREGETRRNLDGLIAPRFAPGVADLLKRKGDKCRLLKNDWLGSLVREDGGLDTSPRFRQIRGGFLKQPNYTFILDLRDPDLVWIGTLSLEQMDTLMLVTSVADTSNSNTITLGHSEDGVSYLIANAVSQQSRVAACKLARLRAQMGNHDTKDAVARSDSFFPQDDGPRELAEMGVRVVLTTSGSINDEKVLAMFKKYGVKVLMIPDAKGRGFFGH